MSNKYFWFSLMCKSFVIPFKVAQPPKLTINTNKNNLYLWYIAREIAPDGIFCHETYIGTIFSYCRLTIGMFKVDNKELSPRNVGKRKSLQKHKHWS